MNAFGDDYHDPTSISERAKWQGAAAVNRWGRRVPMRRHRPLHVQGRVKPVGPSVTLRRFLNLAIRFELLRHFKVLLSLLLEGGEHNGRVVVIGAPFVQYIVVAEPFADGTIHGNGFPVVQMVVKEENGLTGRVGHHAVHHDGARRWGEPTRCGVEKAPVVVVVVVADAEKSSGATMAGWQRGQIATQRDKAPLFVTVDIISRHDHVGTVPVRRKVTALVVDNDNPILVEAHGDPRTAGGQSGRWVNAGKVAAVVVAIGNDYFGRHLVFDALPNATRQVRVAHDDGACGPIAFVAVGRIAVISQQARGQGLFLQRQTFLVAQ
jgi:hypothetical protein